MNERIKILRKHFHLTQQEFADKIGISRGNIAAYEVAKNAPSNAVITLICKVFNANENWIRTGHGEMLVETGRDEEITAWASKITQGDYANKFVPEFAHLLTQLTEKDWERIEWFMKELVEKHEATDVQTVSKEDVLTAIKDIPKTSEELENSYPPIDVSGKHKIG